MILRSILLVAASLLSFALADVEVTSPAAGASLSGLELTVEWKDSGDTPKLADLASYQLFLCAGGNDADDYVRTTASATRPPPTDSPYRFNWQRSLPPVISQRATRSRRR